MTDILAAKWEGSDHTFAKHHILKTYLEAWMPIMSRQSKSLGVLQSNLLFVDGFAGPGSYSGGEDGSPILAIKTVLDHPYDFPIPVNFVFIEKDKERYDLLKTAIENIKQLTDESPKIKSIRVINDDCEIILNRIIDEAEKSKNKVGPALVFLDQFGWSDIPMDLIKKIMCHSECEVFSYLNWDGMNRFLTDQSKHPAISRAFGGNEWKPVLEFPPDEKPLFMLNTYKTALKNKAGSKYVWHFAMCNEDDKLIYWLFFCTNKLRGLEEMKKAMYRVDQSGGFRFSDKNDPAQLSLFKNYNEDELAEELFSTFQGKTISVFEIKEFVLTETPAYLYKSVLRELEGNDKIEVKLAISGKRIKGTFPEDQINNIKVKFSPNTLF